MKPHKHKATDRILNIELKHNIKVMCNVVNCQSYLLICHSYLLMNYKEIKQIQTKLLRSGGLYVKIYTRLCTYPIDYEQSYIFENCNILQKTYVGWTRKTILIISYCTISA